MMLRVAVICAKTVRALRTTALERGAATFRRAATTAFIPDRVVYCFARARNVQCPDGPGSLCKAWRDLDFTFLSKGHDVYV